MSAKFCSFIILYAIVSIAATTEVVSQEKGRSLDSPTKQQSKNDPDWVSLSEKEMKTKLKAYAFAKVRTTLKFKMKYKKERDIRYIACPEMFPEIPGQFPCSLLNLEDAPPIGDSSYEYKEGGVVTILESTDRTPLLGGSSILLSNRDPNSIPKKNQSDIMAYYHTNSYISHYLVGDEVVVFSWKTESGNETLKSILVVQLDSDNWAKTAKEIDFSK
ncbi:hypothetical protein [Leptospira sp. GIMC2001]|uniref:hypothetical protein n=1 Tax=Leptospira sp. GIMC2001 TaxID=1513297 RepID=UPI0023492330|nr:hypothetical protein [Leptospira sp. GIMC2001]WCL50494.1 hypothetical protein O4O04_06650 [Leptospira sp. GIMC2001]